MVRSSRWLPIAVLAAVVLSFYHGLWLPGLVLIKRDAFRVFLPLKQYLVERLASGELPQWFPYESLGRPFIGVVATGVFHPFTVLYFLLPVPDALRVSTLISCVLAALGTFALGRLLRYSSAGALLSGIAFALSGYVVSLTENIQYLYPICALPFFCAALEKALTASRSWVVAPALIWASVVLNGDVQTAYYYGFIALAWTGTRAPRPLRESFVRLGLAGGLTALLAGIQLGPAWAVFQGSERAQQAFFHEQALLFSTHPLRVLTMLVSPVGEDLDPIALGNVFFGGAGHGVWATSLYLGAPVVGLAFLGARHRCDLRGLALLGGLALLLALGRYGGLYELFYHAVSLWSAFRFPEKLAGVVSFAAAMLAGAGLDALRAGRGRAWPWLAAAILCTAVGLALYTDTANAWISARYGAPEPMARAVTGSASHAFLISAAAALGVGVIVTGIRTSALRPEWLLAGLVTIVTCDLARANFEAYYTGPVKAATFTPAFVKTLREVEGALGPGRFRLISTPQSETAWPEYLHRRLGYHGGWSVARRQALDLGHNAEFHIEGVPPYLPGYSAALAVILQQPPSMEVEARFNVRYYIGRRDRLNDPSIAKMLVSELPDYDLALFRNPVQAKPRAYLSQRPERASQPVDPIALIARADFLNGEVDVIETSDATLPGPARAGTAAIERYRPEDVQVRVDTPQPAVLVLLDSFDQGWTATLESGHKLPILRANALFRAVVVPAGNHLVTFRYETPLLRAGALASLAGVAICLVMMVRARRQARRYHSAP